MLHVFLFCIPALAYLHGTLFSIPGSFMSIFHGWFVFDIFALLRVPWGGEMSYMVLEAAQTGPLLSFDCRSSRCCSRGAVDACMFIHVEN